MRKISYLICLCTLLVSQARSEDVRLVNLDPPEAQQLIDSKDTTLKYAPKIESNVPAVRYIGNEPQQVQEDIYLANQYHGQDGLGGYLYGYSVPDIAKTERKIAGGDLRGSYNYINSGQEIKVEYWDDGTGFHQIDNVPRILPKQIEDSPAVKAAKDAHAKRWAEEAERNSKPIENPYANAQPGDFAGLGAGVGAGLGGPPQGQYNPQGQQPQHQGQQPQHQGQQPQLQGQQTYSQGQTGGQKPSFGVQGQNTYSQGQVGGQTPSSGVHQGLQGQQGHGQGQHQGQQNPFGQQGHGQGQQHGQQNFNAQGQQEQSGQQGTNQNRYNAPRPQQAQSGQGRQDYSGQQSQNVNQYAREPQQQHPQQQQGQQQRQQQQGQGEDGQYQDQGEGQYQNENDGDDGAWKDDTEAPTGPPKGFFYNFDYPVGIIVSGHGKAGTPADSIANTYNTNKNTFEQQLKGGAAVHGGGSYPSYQVHS